MTNEVTNETESSTANENSVAAEQTSAAATPTDSVEETATRAAATDESQQPNQVQQGQENAPVSQDATAISASTQNDASSSATSDESKGAGEMDFGAILKQFEQEQTIYHTGELVEGKVVGTSDRGVLIDFGYKSEGIVPVEEFMTPDGELNVKQGDAVEVVIRSIHSGDAPPMLSRLDAVSRKSWAEIEEAFNSETPITGYVIDKTKGGLRVDLNGVEAFLPGSQIDSRPIRNLDVYVGQDIEAKIIKFSRKRNNIVLSRKVLTDEVVNAQKAETLSQIEEGYVVEGTIKNLTEYGAFVDIGGIDGLLHVTDMSWNRMMNPNQLFKVGDHIQVKILKLDRERDKVALGYKQLLADPWSTVTEVYPVNSKLIGKVSSVTDYGAFIELEPGVEGLVHVSEMSWSKRSKSPKKLLNAGEEVDVQVLGIDTNERRISLGMKQLQENPWETILDRYHIGSTVRGRVRNLTDFGAFVEVEEGVDGLVHVSDISHSKKIKHPKDVLRRDQEVEAVITSIDTRGRRMSLSIKELTPSAWEQFITTHKPGDVVRGKVSRFAGFGVFVQLADELEGLCHISELSDERVERPEDVVSIGQEMDFKILRIEHEEQKIGLSARAVGKGGEEASAAADSKMYSSEAKGGMASLGELMNLKRGGAPTEDGEPMTDEPRLSKKERRVQRAAEKSAQEDVAVSSATDDASSSDDDLQSNQSVDGVAASNGEIENQDAGGEIASHSRAESTETNTSNVEVSAQTIDEKTTENNSPQSEPATEDTLNISDSAAAETAQSDDATDKNAADFSASSTAQTSTNASAGEDEGGEKTEITISANDNSVAAAGNAPANEAADSETAQNAEEKSANS